MRCVTIIQTILWVLAASCILAQDEPSSRRDSFPRGDQLIVKNSDNFIAERIKGVDRQYFRGNVRIVQDSVFMFCDSAAIRENQLTATGDVIIIQNDSVQVFSDSLFYDGDRRFAHLNYGVVLLNGDRKLFTEALDYDLNTKMATYRDTAIMQKGSMKLSSISGTYNMTTKEAFFRGDVVILDDAFELSSDSLKYNLGTDIAIFTGPTYIIQNNRKIYCEEGYYDVKKQTAFFAGDAHIRDEVTDASARNIYYSGPDSLLVLTGEAMISDTSGIARGDQIRINEATGEVFITGNGSYRSTDRFIIGTDIIYNTKTEDIYLKGRSSIHTSSGILEGDTISYLKAEDLGIARGHVIWHDTSRTRTLQSDLLTFRDSNAYYKALSVDQRPLFMQIVDGDSLFVAADSLENARLGETGDTLQYMVASGAVRIYKSDFQAACDSLYYSDRDSSFTLYYDPICWSDTTQFKADTIRMVIRNASLEKLIALGNASIFTKLPGKYFNQIRAQSIHSHLASGSIEEVDARGNAQSIYMVEEEEGAYLGPNKTLCSRIYFYFINDSLDRVKFSGQPDSELTPVDKATEKDLFLEGFLWQPERRPYDVAGIRQRVARKRPEQSDLFKSAIEDLIHEETDTRPSKKELILKKRD